MEGKLTKIGGFWFVNNEHELLPLNPYYNTKDLVENKEVEYIKESFWETGMETSFQIATLKDEI